MKRLIAYWNPDQDPERDEPVSYTLDGEPIDRMSFERQ
jgi:hypothetical protein